LRKLIGAPLTPSAVETLRSTIGSAADTLVADLVSRGQFDAVKDLAQYLPLTIVSHMVGLPEEGRESMLTWAAATFDLFGPENDRTHRARPIVQEMRSYVASLGARDKVKAGSWADRLLDHVDNGAIPRAQFFTLLRDYLGPSLDTTIFATANLIWLFSRYPDQWGVVRSDPSLIRNAINEAVRLESPIRGFTRVVTSDTEVGGVTLPAKARVLLLYASANRDERKWDNPEAFDVRRRVVDHVGFGFGVHTCAGMHLARLEIECLVKALIPRVKRFDAAAPVHAINNTLRGLASLSVSVA
jgi:cytochrome P450